MAKDLSVQASNLEGPSRSRTRPQRLGLLGLLAFIFIISLHYLPAYHSRISHCLSRFTIASHNKNDSSWCPLPSIAVSQNDSLEPSHHLMRDEQLALQVERLSAAVRVPTESHDDNGDVDDDPRWETFEYFHDVLKKLFPLVHTQLELQKVNRYGLLYELQGSESSLKPILFMAHQDVVPADANAAWTHPPYEGHYDGSFLWGRGSADCKNVLIGVLSVIEDLLSQSFTPRRTIVLAFGFDEETGGLLGATKLNEALIQKWGQDSFLLVLDEGGMGLKTVGNVLYAYPGVGEKGYHDVQLTLDVQGGHSSRPPPHTAIGIISDAVISIESRTYDPRLPQGSPFRRVLECRAKYSPNEVQPWLRDSLLHDDEEEVARKLVHDLEEEKWLMQTSQAVDVISGGIKVNALPETVRVSVNHRVALHESIEDVNIHIQQSLAPIVKKYDLLFHGPEDASSDNSSSAGTLKLHALQTLPAAPISPTDNSVWEIFSGTLRYVFESTHAGSGKTVVPVGNIMTGNTDTMHYWNLTRNIYRYTPSRDGTRLNAHAIDERMNMIAHLEGMRFYYDLIRNFDNWNEE